MTIKQNKNFKSVKVYDKSLSIHDVMNLYNKKNTKHLDDSRKKRMELAINLNEKSDVDKIFVVDKNHPDGEELHIITKNGIIFILNKNKFENNLNSFITVLIARENQVKRLYDDCHLKVDNDILLKCKEYEKKGYNNS